MKKRNIVLLILLPLILFATVPAVYAWQTGGSAGGGGTSGGGANILVDSGKTYDSGTYLFELVYKPQNSNNREVLGCAIVYSGSHRGNIGDIATKARASSNANNCKYTSSGPLQTLASQLNSQHLDHIPIISSREVAENYLKEFNPSFNINTLNKPGSEPGNINSYGYRILIQKLTCFGFNGECKVLYPRKAFANDYPNNLLFGGSYQTDIYTTQDDIGIRKAQFTSWQDGVRGNCYNDSLCKPLGRNFADYNKGEGYNIIGFDPDIFGNHDYSIDAACENCDNNNENGSYFIQDTTDWGAILASKYSKIENAKTYYKKKIGSCEVYCREEYRITFPNANNQITTEAGRFFTVNKLGGAMYSAGVPNFKQIKIEKVRECRATGGNQQSCLASFASTAKSKTDNSAGETGTIKLTYKEDYKDSKYNPTLKLNENKNRTISKEEYVNSSISGSNIMLKSTVIKYYELPDETYQWVDVRDGVSSLEKPTAGLEHFLDVGTSNLPISHDNYSKTSKASKGAEVTFDYSLPTNSEDPYTLIKKAFNAKNDYFLDSSSKPTDNIYAKAKKGALNSVEQEQITNSACAKLFGYGTSKYNSCVNARTSNKAGNCYTQVTADGKYKCDVNVCPEGQSVVVKCENGKQKVVCSDEPTSAEECPGDTGEKICKIENGKYYGQNGKEVSKEEYMVECPQICKVVDGKYYGKNGQLTTRKQYEAECPDKCAVNCEAGYCCPDLDMVCPTKDENGMWSCPGRGGNKIIYRPIDLNNPFPGQTNYNRAAGANWCAYNVETGKTNCKSTNGVATTHIQNNRSTADENVYNLTPLYEVDLDPTIIKSIRKYNKDKKYDDFTLNCTNEKSCYSTFLRESNTGLKITGICANKSNLATCAESRR